jgi:hypothetical protein
MSVTGLAVFDETMQKTNTQLKEISETLGSDRHRAYQVSRAVLHRLCNRLIVDEVTDLGDQLPILVGLRGLAAVPKPCERSDRKKIFSSDSCASHACAHRARGCGARSVRGAGETYHKEQAGRHT